MEPLQLAVVVPALNAAATLAVTLARVQGVDEIVVVDGGSTDATTTVAAAAGARVITAPRGRGGQLAAGVAATTAPWLLLLHADTRLGPDWEVAAARHVRERPNAAAYFRLAFDSPAPQARRLERVVAWRSRALGLPYGDQGLVVARTVLAEAGGMRPLPLMEDVDLARRLGRGRLAPLDAVALTSARRYETEGWTRRSARNLLCLSLYGLGLPPARIARLYG